MIKYVSIELNKIKHDSAIGNIAEVAFGVLGTYGIKSVGKTLLDEKLGFHIALGRSEHLGGMISPSSFKLFENVWHQDFVYIKEMQSKINVKEITLIRDNNKKLIIKDTGLELFK